MDTIVGIDIGTTKICTVMARVEADGQLRILGVGIEPSAGIRKGTVIDVAAASNAVGLSVDKVERISGREVTSAWVSIAGSHVTSMNSQGVASVHHQVIDQDDIARAMDAAAAVSIPHNREVIHVIQRGFTVDGQDGIHMPLGMHGYRMEVETHIITASGTTVDNLRLVVGNSGVEVDSFVLNPLASGEVVLTDTEREMGVVVCDIGGGTTDMALYIEGDIYHTMVLAVGGNHITSDIAHGLRLPFSKAEEVKINHGHALTAAINPAETFPVRAFGEDNPVDISRMDLVHIIEARVEEIFSLMLQEIKRSGYDGLLPAGVVLTGGSSQLPGIRRLASEVMGLPVRVARPENLVGMVDQLHSPAYSTSVGLLKWAANMHPVAPGVVPKYVPLPQKGLNWERIKDALRRLLP